MFAFAVWMPRAGACCSCATIGVKPLHGHVPATA
jgi:hypothetical protein